MTQRDRMMRAARVIAPGKVRVEEVRVPEPGPGQLLVRLEGCGVCGSNLPAWEGRPWFKYPLAPGQLGHEGWGRIERVGESVSEFQPGQRVAFLSYHGFAEYDLAEADAVVPLPPALDDQPFPGEALGCALNVFRRSAIEPGQTVTIIGIGFLGAVLTNLSARAGARVIAISRRASALAMAKQCGAAETIPLEDHKFIVDRVRQLTQGRGCSRVIEAVGQPWPLDLAGELTSERGRLVIAGYHQDGKREINLQLWNWRGLDVINAHERETRVYVDGIRAAAESVASGTLNPAPLYSHRFQLNQLGDALEHLHTRPPGFMKALVTL